MPAATRLAFEAGAEPIEGYTLRERIGVGGFGEVWRSEAPGGIEKAIKLVYGTLDSERAARELRSLERIKGVRHPFLLALERFEIVQERLVIVTELADGSLEDLLREHRERGSCGLPRERLLELIGDAADALDYLHQNYRLLHLDIKPGNLLLLGGRVKVADFGLLKELQETDCSMIGGLTPVYAAPELFDGRPSVHSDQYSLAVMYQELLVGQRPFAGRTLAQLATQHVHTAPDLRALPAADRPVIARALEKSPDRRYPSCRELVDRLRRAPQRPRRIPSSATGETPPAGDTTCGTLGTPAAARVHRLPKIDLDGRAPRTARRTALVVALGGFGATVARALRGRARDADGTPPCLLIDTDPETLEAACGGASAGEADGAALAAKETFLARLRTAQEYRKLGSERLASVSRRWIFNVPRSARTESLRPLGRLALLDHAASIGDALRHALGAFADAPEADPPPVVYLVASLAGGTGSGMVLDIAHLLRHQLDELALAAVDIRPLLHTAWTRPGPNPPLPLGSSLAALTELQHFLLPGNGFQGDAGAGIPTLPAARSPLASTYLIADANVAAAAEQAVAYLDSDLSPAGAVLEAARQPEPDAASPGAVLTVRSCSVHRLRLPTFVDVDALGCAAASAWLQPLIGRSSRQEHPPEEEADRWLSELGVAPASRAAPLASGTRGEAGEVCRRAERLLADQLRAGRLTFLRAAEIAIALPDRLLQTAARTGGGPPPEPLRQTADQLRTAATHIAQRTRWLASVDRELQALSACRGGIEPDGWDASLRARVVRSLADRYLADLLTCGPHQPGRTAPAVFARRLASDAAQATRRELEKHSRPDSPFVFEPADAEELAKQVRGAAPSLLACGGSQRLVLVVGTAEQRRALQPRIAEAYGGPLSLAVIPGWEPTLICEAQHIPLAAARSRLLTALGPEQAIAARLHARTDIRWEC